MYRSLIWGTGKVFYQNINLLHHYEQIGAIEIIGLTSNTTIFCGIDGWRYLPKKSIDSSAFDLVIVMADKRIPEMITEIRSLGIEEEKIVLYRALNIPNLVLSDYLILKKRIPSIFSCNCWGG